MRGTSLAENGSIKTIKIISDLIYNIESDIMLHKVPLSHLEKENTELSVLELFFDKEPSRRCRQHDPDD